MDEPVPKPNPQAPADEPSEPIYVLALGVVVGCMLAPWLEPHVPLLPIAVIAAIAAVAIERIGLAGFAVGLMFVATIPPGPELDGAVVIEGTVIGAPRSSVADVSVTAWARPGGVFTPSTGRVRVRFGTTPPAVGADIVVVGTAGPVDAQWLPGEPDPVVDARRAHVNTQVKAASASVIGAPTVRPADAFDGLTYGGVARAMATGDRADADPALLDALRLTGTSHVLSISGFHVGVVGGLIGGTLDRIRRRMARWRSIGFSEALPWVIGAGAGATYAFVTGGSAAAQRAGIAVLIVVVGKLLGRRPRPLSLLGAAAIAVLAIDPAALGTAGFQLSFGAMIGLVRISPWFEKRIPPDWPFVVRWPLSVLGATVGATAGTFAASAWWFQELAPTAPVANLIALPLTSIFTVPLALAAVALPSPLDHLAAWGADRSVWLLYVLLSPLAVTPLHPAIGPVTAMGLAALLLWPRRVTMLAVALGGLVAADPGLPDGPTLVVFDVGQGACALVQTADGRRVLIDGGPPGDRVARWLRREHIGRIDVVIATHPHDDHIGGLPAVLGAVDVGALWLPGPQDAAPLVQTALQQHVPVEFHPEMSTDPLADDPNDRSLVGMIDGIAFLGDLGMDHEDRLAGRVGPASILLVPHHGASTASGATLLSITRPRLAIVQAGRGNGYGHPHAAALDRYREADIPVARTDEVGTITLDLESFEASAVRPGGRETRLP